MWFMVGLDLKDATGAINGLKTNAILIRTKTNNKLTSLHTLQQCGDIITLLTQDANQQQTVLPLHR